MTVITIKNVDIFLNFNKCKCCGFHWVHTQTDVHCNRAQNLLLSLIKVLHRFADVAPLQDLVASAHDKSERKVKIKVTFNFAHVVFANNHVSCLKYLYPKCGRLFFTKVCEKIKEFNERHSHGCGQL